jgi:uncharacterized protein (TIGR03067 family)/predicted Zn finger-like uncharacterized protein
MTLQIKCPACGKQYSLRDDMAGRSVRCKACQTSFRALGLRPASPLAEPPVTAAPPEPPPEKPKSGRRSAADRPKSRKSKKVLVIVGAVAALVLFGCCGGGGVGGYLIYSRTRRVTNQFEKEMAQAQKEFQSNWDKTAEDAAKRQGEGRAATGGSASVSAPRSDSGGPLDGTYSVASVEMSGQKVPADRVAKLYGNYLISNGMLSYAVGGQNASGQMKINDSAQPPQLDVTGNGATIYCIYKLDGSTLTLCMGGADPAKRPKEFKTSAKDGFALLVLKKK